MSSDCWSVLLQMALLMLVFSISVVEAYDRRACVMTSCTCSTLVDSILLHCNPKVKFSPLDVGVFNRIQDVRLRNYEVTNKTIQVLDRLDIVNLEFYNCLIDESMWKSRPRFYTRTRLSGSSVMNVLVMNSMNNLPENVLNVPLFQSIRTIITQLTIRNSRFILGRGQFTEYRSIRSLALTNCSLRSLTSESFRGLVNTLRYLDVTGNHLVSQDLKSLHNFHLYELSILSGNDIVCNETFMNAMDRISTFNNSLVRTCYTDYKMMQKLRSKKKFEGLKGILVWKNGFICLLGIFCITIVLSTLYYSTIHNRIIAKKIEPLTKCRQLPEMY